MEILQLTRPPSKVVPNPKAPRQVQLAPEAHGVPGHAMVPHALWAQMHLLMGLARGPALHGVYSCSGRYAWSPKRVQATWNCTCLLFLEGPRPTEHVRLVVPKAFFSDYICLYPRLMRSDSVKNFTDGICCSRVQISPCGSHACIQACCSKRSFSGGVVCVNRLSRSIVGLM